jgi:nucleoid-associated protein YgaU
VATAIALTNTAVAGGDLGAPSPSGSSSGGTQLEKASLDLYEAKPKASGGGSEIGGSLGSVPFQFNPKELSITKSAKWERKPARGSKTAGAPEFSGAEPAKLTVEMFLDATGDHGGGVVKAVEALLACCVPTEATLGQKKAMPPLVIFHWGRTTSFVGYVSQVGVKFTLFASDGTPIRATCSVSMEEMPDGAPKQNPTSGAIAVRRVATTVAGDSLASLAYREYGDATMWRELATYNGIDDPLRVPTGTSVLLPPPEDLARGR